jgi:hypothetical protein
VHTRIPLANILKRGRKTERITCQRKSSAIGTSGTSGTWGTSFGYIGNLGNIFWVHWEHWVQEEHQQEEGATFSLAIICITNPRYTLARELSTTPARKFWSPHYICRMFVLPNCQRTFPAVFLTNSIFTKQKTPCISAKGFSI